MKILFVTSLYATNEIGGAEKVVSILAKGVAHRGHEAIVLSVSLDDADHAFELDGVTVYQIRQSSIYSPWPANRRGFLSRAIWHTFDIINPLILRRVGAVLDQERPDVVHSHILAGFTLAPWLATKRRETPLVHTVHDWYLRCINSAMYCDGQVCNRPCNICRLYRLPHRQVSNGVDVAIGVSEFIMRHHLESNYFMKSRVRRTISNSYDGVICEPRSGSIRRPVRFGFLGRLAPAKGIATLLETFRTLDKDGWELVVGGRGSAEFEAAIRKRNSDPRVDFLGQTNSSEFFRKIDVLIVPSLWHDPAPLVVLEAYGNGVPVIASRRGGLTETVQEGRTGYLFEPNCPGELSCLISRLIDDPSPLASMRTRCVAAARRFTNDRMIEAYLDVYGEAADARRGAAMERSMQGAAT